MSYKAKHMDGATYWHAEEEDGLDERCGGLGMRNCYCGGDFCCCGNEGEAQCDGCPDCEGMSDEDEERRMHGE